MADLTFPDAPVGLGAPTTPRRLPSIADAVQRNRDRVLIEPSLMVFTGFSESLQSEVKFKFRINPNNLKRARRKLGQYILTKFGYERQNWGNDLHTFSYSGSTGTFKPEDGFDQSGPVTFDIRGTEAYEKFKSFETFYEETGNRQRLVGMQYWGFNGEFFGSLDDFDFNHSAERDPYRFLYNFKFTGIPQAQPEIEVQRRLTPESPFGDLDVNEISRRFLTF